MTFGKAYSADKSTFDLKRRTILATTGISVDCGLAGCLGSDAPTDSSTPGDGGDDPSDDGSAEMTAAELEQCHLVSIDYELTAQALTGHEATDEFGFRADVLPCPWDSRYDRG